MAGLVLISLLRGSWCPISDRILNSLEMKQDTAIIRAFLGFAAAVIAVLQQPHSLHSQPLTPPPPADTRAAGQPAEPAHATGTLEGMVTLACRYGAIDCTDRPYHVGLFIQEEQRIRTPIYVDASPRFSITLEAGSYTISSADTRGAFGLPILEPITAMISPGTVMYVDVKFQPGLELPRR